MTEIWKDVKGFEGLYRVSNTGKVLSLPRNGTNGGIRKQSIDKDGYKQIILFKDNKKYYKRVHRLVAEAFIPNLKEKPEINHLNNNRKDNRVENLEWCTNKENLEYSHKQKRQRINAKPIKAINKDLNLVLYFKSEREASRFLSIKQYKISRYLNNKNELKGWNFEYAN